MANFFNELQGMMLNREKENIKVLIPYYETLLQHENEIKELIDEVKKWSYVEIDYDKANEDDYYTNGILNIRFYEDEHDWRSQPDFYYQIELGEDDRPWGYCECEPHHEGYNEDKKCCGDGCDWTAPRIEVRKVIDVAFKSFVGVERDMWKLEEKWDKALEKHKEKEKLAQVTQLEDQIRRAQEEIERINKR